MKAQDPLCLCYFVSWILMLYPWLWLVNDFAFSMTCLFPPSHMCFQFWKIPVMFLLAACRVYFALIAPLGQLASLFTFGSGVVNWWILKISWILMGVLHIKAFFHFQWNGSFVFFFDYDHKMIPLQRDFVHTTTQTLVNANTIISLCRALNVEKRWWAFQL